MLDFTKEFKEVKIYSAVFWYIFTIFIIVLFATIIVNITGNSNLLNNDNLLSLFSTSLFIIILLYKFDINKNKLLLMIKNFFNRVSIKEIVSIVATQLCLSMGISSLLIGIVYFLYPHILNELLSESSVSEAYTYGGLFISMLVTVICAPVMEELFFRAIIFKRISKKFNIYVGMIISSAIFGLLHIELAIIGAFFFGLACCILYVKYKNILFPMSLHFLNNLLAFLPQLNINSTKNSSPITHSDAQTFIILGSVLFLIGLFFFIRFIILNKRYLREGFS